MDNLNFDEAKQSQLPFVEMLINLGYRYISSKEIEEERNKDKTKFILKKTALKKFSEINDYESNGETHKFSENDIEKVIEELENIKVEGLIDTSQEIYNKIMSLGGKTLKIFENGKTVSKNFKYIDFKNPEKNDFAVTVEFEATGKRNIRLDIVIFVNGIPFVIIENKKSSVKIIEALDQLNSYQNPQGCPKLFVYPQLLIAVNKKEFLYGTTKTPNKFYAKWREKSDDNNDKKINNDYNYENDFKKIISKSIDDDIYNQLINDLNGSLVAVKQRQGSRMISEQDRGIMSMLTKKRLLDITKNFILYDTEIKKIARYQQYFAVKKFNIKTNQRRGGIIWHTQGSGKSLTMVMLVKSLIENPDITNPRVLIVTDRTDLDRQIKDVFAGVGLKKDVIQAKNGGHLLKLIKEKDLRVVTTLVHKFISAGKKRADFIDKDSNIFVLIDEAHRTQGGFANLEMNKIIPNACYIAFTGTPLLKHEKSQQKFGPFIDKYTIDDALKDGIILPLIYEGRYVDLRQDKKEIDKQSERLWSRIAEPKVKYKLQNQVKKQIIQDNPQRIEEIANDIEKHFNNQLKDTGLKAQIVAPSKYSAVLFQKYFEESNIKTALVLSDENNNESEEDEHRKEVKDYLAKIKANYKDLKTHEKRIIENFKHNEDGIEIIIVVDKLLTGFDAPCNTVLYLAKELKDHNLLQAIARVNRLYDNKNNPKTAGYIIDYSKNAANLKTAMQLFGNYDEEDIKSALIDGKDKIQELETSYSDLHDIFKGVPKDDEAYRQFLEDEPIRKQFYESLNHFLKNFNECMLLQDFVHDFKHLEVYRMELKKFLNLKKDISATKGDDIDFRRHKQALIRIMDRNIKAEEVELLTKPISLSDKNLLEKVVENLDSDKSKAEAISCQVQKVISERMKKDPEFYKKMSDKIKKLLKEMREGKITDVEALKQARLFEDEVLNKTDNLLPLEIKKVNGGDIFYRNLSSYFKNLQTDKQKTIEIILKILQILKEESIVDWHLNDEVKRVMSNKLDDYFYDVLRREKRIKFSSKEIAEIIEKTMNLAQNNYEVLN